MSSARPTPLLPAPGIPGLWFRTFRDESDRPAIVELLSAASADRGVVAASPRRSSVVP